jgi:hypothetical protein
MSDTVGQAPETRPTTVYNLEETLIEAGLEPVASEEELDALPDEDVQKAFVRWTTGKTPEDLQPLFDHVTAQAGERVAQWSGLVATHEALPAYGREHDLAIISRYVPHEIVEAYANGLESAWGVPIAVRAGSVLGKHSDGTYKGLDDWLHKRTLLVTLNRQENRTLAVVADSFADGDSGLFNSQHPILVDADGKREERWRDRVDILRTDPDRPEIAKLIKAGEDVLTVYNLEEMHEAEAFINALYGTSDSD